MEEVFSIASDQVGLASECDFRLVSEHPHQLPLTGLALTYFEVLGSPRSPVKLLKVMIRRELARSHSTTELLPLSKEYCTKRERALLSNSSLLPGPTLPMLPPKCKADRQHDRRNYEGRLNSRSVGK